jgi:uncharacterized protein YifN (PemK superfamily)
MQSVSGRRQPDKKQVVRCDFTGLKDPEMTKVRPVIVLAQHKSNSRLITVVPLSGTPPHPELPFHVQLSINPLPWEKKPVWAKCDLAMTVSIDRINRYSQRIFGSSAREWLHLQVSDEEFEAVRHGVRIAFDLVMVDNNLDENRHNA